jgi:hypothetical protein
LPGSQAPPLPSPCGGAHTFEQRGRAGGRLAFALVLALTASAQAKRVLVLGRGGHVIARTDRYIPATEPVAGSPAPATKARPRRHHGRVSATVAASGPTVLGALQTLYQQGQITSGR